ncbi:MAG: hypothetical protein QOE38_1869 [Thermoleophilaceae bacterium]|nr:hypothetical protein [Thermoleophilaceae bacterium]
MLNLLAEAGPSKTPFYIVGGLLVLWAVIVSLLGISRPTFPGGEKNSRAVMALSVVLVVCAMAAAVISS